MGSISEISPLIQEIIRKAVGISSNDLRGLTSAELDGIILSLKAGPPITKYRVGGWYSGEGAQDTLLLTNQVLVLGPILVEKYIVVEEIGCDITTTGTEGNFYTAIYRDRGDGYPGSLVHASAALGVTAVFKSTSGLSVKLTPGLYWGGVVVNSVVTTAATVRSLINNSKYVGGINGTDDIDFAGYSEAAVTGAPNANFTSTPTVVGEVPRLVFKVKNAA